MTTQSESTGHRSRGLATYVAIVVACAIIPAVIALVGWVDTQRQDAINQAERWTQVNAEKIAERHRDFFNTVRSTLEMLSLAPTVRRTEAFSCTSLLRETKQRRDWMHAAWVVDADGNTLCATDPALPSPALDATMRHRLTIEGFALGDLHTNPVSGNQVLVAAQPVDTGGSVRHVLIEVDIDTRRLGTFAELTDTRDGSLVIALDRNGRAISYGDSGLDLTGELVGDHPVVQSVVHAAGQPVTGAFHDGVNRIFSAASVPEWGATIIVGVGRDTVLATSRRDLLIGLGLMAILLLLTAGIAFFSADRLIMRSVRSLRDTALAGANGSFGQRAVVHHGPREVRELADAFNRMTERLEHLALHDQLTGLPNRRYLDAFLGDLRRTRVPYAVMVLDVDGFKPINDHHGHAVGDSILSALAERMRKTVSADGFCARVGGDEFVIVVTGHAHAVLPLRVIVLGERIRESAAVPVSLDGKTLSVTSSIGIALGDNPAGDPTEMFRNADRALYAAKASGRNRLVVFDGTQPDVVVEHHDRGNARSAA